MAETIDRMDLNKNQHVKLDDDGVIWIVQEEVTDIQAAQTIRLEVAAAGKLFSFFLRIALQRDGFTLEF